MCFSTDFFSNDLSREDGGGEIPGRVAQHQDDLHVDVRIHTLVDDSGDHNPLLSHFVKN